LGYCSEISRHFHTRFQFFKRFSRRIASSIESCTSISTSRVQSHFAAKADPRFSRCASIRARLHVTPIYNTPNGLFVMM